MFFDSGVHLRDIQILMISRQPYVHLEDNVREKIFDKEVKVSITHEKKIAAAVAIITGD